MHIASIDIRNFRQIEKCKISFQQGMNLLIGENGKGKTSILEAIAVALGGFFVSISEVKARSFSMAEVRTEYRKEGDGGYTPYHYWPTVTCEAVLDGTPYSWTRERKNRRARTGVRPRDICHIAETLANSPNAILPVISYQSASRIWAQKREKNQDVFRRKIYPRTVGYVDCLDDESGIKMLLNWCVKMEQIAWQKGEKVSEYEGVKTTVAKAITMLDDKPSHVFYDRQTEELMCRQDGLVQPVSIMSAGYQSFIWMVFDIAYRMAVLNPSMRQSINHTPGVILIDEIDMHLHPRWQWRVLDVLHTVFPKVQFIVTTHSPVIIASARDIRCIDLSNIPTITYRQNGYGFKVDEVLGVLQGTKDWPDAISLLLQKFYRSLKEQNWVEADHLLQQLRKEVGPDRPIYAQAKSEYELEKAFAEDLK